MRILQAGVDFGGTKIELAVLDLAGDVIWRRRARNPGNYPAAVTVVRDLVNVAETHLNVMLTVGIGIPGAIDPVTARIKNANTTWLNDTRLDIDVAHALGRAVRVQNDANCFALSEAVDGAAAGKRVVFGVIIGTGVGGGIVVDGKLLDGLHRIGGEWGHNPLPWPRQDEFPMPSCFCGNVGCLERFVAGPSLAADCDGPGHWDASALPDRAAAGDIAAGAGLRRHADRLARGLAQVVNLLDPDAIVLGGGLSNMQHLYDVLPRLMARNVIADDVVTPILQNRYGDSSGVRGAAWLWPRSSDHQG